MSQTDIDSVVSSLEILLAGESFHNSGVRTVMLGIASGLDAEGIRTKFLAPKCKSTEGLDGHFLPAKLRGAVERGYYGTPCFMPELNDIVRNALSEVDLCVVQSISALSARTMEVKRRMLLPPKVIYHGHTMDDEYLKKWLWPGVSHAANLALGIAMKRIILDHVDLIVVPSELLADMYVRRFKFKVRPTVWSAPIEIPDDLPEETELDFDGRFTLIYVGRIGKEKNIAGLLKLFSLFYSKMPARLILIGGGEIDKFRSLADSLPYAAGAEVIFLGNQDVTRVHAINRKASRSDNAIGISCSTTETQGVAFLEHLAAGLPGTAYDSTVWAKEINRSGAGLLMTGYLEHDANLLKELARDHARRAHMAESGPALIAECYNPQIQYKKLAGVYRQVAAS